MSYAVLSCDLDTVDRHLQGYGVEDLPPCDVIYRTAVPRLLELLAELRLPAVLFTIARDAAAQRRLLRDATVAGHEIASHSMTHPQPFHVLDDATLEREIAGSRRALEQAVGEPVLGFRAPAWDVDRRVLEHVAAAGYVYDASTFPTPVLIASRLAVRRRSAGHGPALALDMLGSAFGRRAPHRCGPGELLEFPISVTPRLRLPVYHTFSYFVPRPMFARLVRAVLRSPSPLFYEFHAADLLDAERDGVDPRLSRHPALRVPFARRRDALRDVLASIAKTRRVLTYRQAIAEDLTPTRKRAA